MKKLATISAIALLSLGVTACKKADPATEYKAFQAWQQTQAPVQAEAQAQFQQQLATIMAQPEKDPKALEPVLQTFATKIQSVVKSLDTLDIKSDEIKALKDKTKAVLALSSEVLTEQVKVLATPTPEAQQAVQAKAMKLTEDAKALQALEAELKAKFAK